MRPYSPAKPLGLAMVAVVVSFTASLIVSHYSARSIDSEVLDIAATAAPSIDHLAVARTELRRLATYPSLYVAWRSEGAQTSLASIEESRRKLAEEWDAYRALPRFPGERELMAPASQELPPLFALVGRVLTLIDSGDLASARVLWHADMLPAVERLDGTLERLVTHNAAYSQLKAEEISRVRHRAAMLGVGLGVLSVVLAVAAALMAFETLRRHDRLVAERNVLVEARAAELEQFAGRVAHDIKSPLGAVGLALQLARRGAGGDARVEAVTTRALASVQRVQQIVDGLLTFAKAGARPEPGVASPLSAVAGELVDELRPLAEEHKIALTVDCTGELWVACAPGTLASMVSNLVRNAIKFTCECRDRRVQVRISDRGRAARLEVQDTGPGIPAHLQALIFEPYVRGLDGDKPGIGLGLATVKRLCEAHGGRVGVHSEVGHGSCFWVELPKADPQREANVGNAEISPAPAPG